MGVGVGKITGGAPGVGDGKGRVPVGGRVVPYPPPPGVGGGTDPGGRGVGVSCPVCGSTVGAKIGGSIGGVGGMFWVGA